MYVQVCVCVFVDEQTRCERTEVRTQYISGTAKYSSFNNFLFERD